MRNILIKTLGILVAIPLVLSACGGQSVQAESEKNSTPKTAVYQLVLGKSLSDEAVVKFIADNKCSLAVQFELCKEIGMALWVDASEMVKSVYLYAGTADGFRRYHGILPYGLSFYDPMWRVEEKLSNLNADETAEPSLNAGLPDEESVPDHLHYWALYKRFGIIVIYDSPFADEDAYIYAVVVNA